MNSDAVKFLKWAGGKRMLLPQLDKFIPQHIERYIEPFVGSGAVFWHVAQTRAPKTIIIADSNAELICAYEVVRDHVEELIKRLEKHHEKHHSNADYFYEVREKNPLTLKPVERAARFIYLNRTCFNGLYRVNSKGKFNVPRGSYKNPNIVQANILRKASVLLKDVTIKAANFSDTLSVARKGDFVYFDPPYHPLNGTSFTTYSSEAFLEKEQVKLKEEFDRLTKLGCFCVESNSDTPFIRKLYKDYTVHIIKAKRLINASKDGRGAINEVVITNFQTNEIA